MATVTGKMTLAVANNGGAQVSAPPALAYAGDQETLFSEQIAISTTNAQYSLSWLNSKLQFLYCYADQTVTLKSNSTSSPGSTVTLAGGVPQIYPLAANPFVAADVTTMYITNASGSVAANVVIYRVSNG